MPRDSKHPLSLDIVPATRGRWRDLERLFGRNGACGGCWCMLWRLSRSRFEAQKGEGNRCALRRIVEARQTPGVIAFEDGEPVGWCAVAPRPAYPALERSRIFKPIDDRPVWSISCLFVAKAHRRRSISVALIRAAADHAFRHGAESVEAYPFDPREPDVPPPFVWTGLLSAYLRAGFQERARRSPTRPIVRLEAARAGKSRDRARRPRRV
jgi:GNAT superfamily N-acetyltransferase